MCASTENLPASLKRIGRYASYLLGHLEDTADCLFQEGGMDGFKWLMETFAPENGCDDKKMSTQLPVVWGTRVWQCVLARNITI